MNETPHFKNFDPDTFQDLAPDTGCMVSNRVCLENHTIQFMVREDPENSADSGWTFFSGIGEDDEYVNNPDNFTLFTLNTIANVDQTIVQLLESPVGTAYEKLPDSNAWVEVNE